MLSEAAQRYILYSRVDTRDVIHTVVPRGSVRVNWLYQLTEIRNLPEVRR